jgi:hypothetical protein
MVGPLSGFDPRDQLQPLCSVNAAHRILNPRSGGSSPSRGTTWPCSPIPAEATGREPVQWRFESAHGHHIRLVAQLADAARSDRADRGSNPREPTIPAWRNWRTRPAQTRLNATGLRPEHMWVDPRVRQGEAEALLLADARSPNPTAGTILRGRGAARVAASLSAKRPTGSNPVRPARKGSSFNGRIPGLHPGDEGSIPSESTISRPSFKGWGSRALNPTMRVRFPLVSTNLLRREGTATLEVS